MMSKNCAFPVVILLLLLLAACSAPPQSVDLSGTGWNLTDMGGNSPLPNTSLTLVFDEESAGGSSGCNSYGGTYQIDGDALTFGQFVSTLMACEPDILAQESAYLEMLAKTAFYRLDGDKLTLLDSSRQPLAAFSAQEPLSLANTEWSAVAYIDGNRSVVSLVEGTNITIRFNQDGSLTGFSGCNDYSSTYQLNGDSISIAAPISTLMLCNVPPGVADQETLYLQALAKVASYRVTGTSLELLDASGTVVASFLPAGNL